MTNQTEQRIPLSAAAFPPVFFPAHASLFVHHTSSSVDHAYSLLLKNVLYAPMLHSACAIVLN